MASAYIQKLQDMDGNDIYPMTVADAVYVQTTSGSTVSQQKLTDKLADMENSFQVGCNTLVSKLEELGITPSSSSPTDIAEAIQTACSTYYNKGVAAADARVNKSSASYSQGVADADARVNTSSASYSRGVTDADNRANSNSTNWKDGYNNGYNAGYNQGKADADTSSAYNNGYNAGVAAGKAAVSGSVSATCYWSNDNDGGGGTRAATNGQASATATISGGKLSVSVSGYSKGTAWRWEGDSWISEHSCEASNAGGNSQQIA